MPTGHTILFTQIAAVSCANNFQTQCNYVLFGLDRTGRIWQRTDQQEQWERVEHPALLTDELETLQKQTSGEQS